MYGIPLDLNTFDLAAACVAVLSLLALLLFGKNWISLLWALLLTGVATSILMLPDRLKDSVVGGCAAAIFLMLISEMRARRKERVTRAELARLSTAIADMQNRNILAEVRLAGMTPRTPISEKSETSPSLQKMKE
jgi:hypothetical protein